MMTDDQGMRKEIRELEVTKSEHGAWVTIELNVPFGADMDAIDALSHGYRDIRIETTNRGYPTLTLYADPKGLRERMAFWKVPNADRSLYEWESVMNDTGTVAVRRSPYTDIDLRLDVFGDDRIVTESTVNLYAQEARDLIGLLRGALSEDDGDPSGVPIKGMIPDDEPLGRLYVFRDLDAGYEAGLVLVNNGAGNRLMETVLLTRDEIGKLIGLMEERLDERDERGRGAGEVQADDAHPVRDGQGAQGVVRRGEACRRI